jgi:glutamate carboxypeptidase
MGHAPPTLVATRTIPGKPALLLSGHLDTVFHPNGTFKSLVTDERQRTAMGPGVVDMKGGILIALVALEALHEAGIELSWTFVLSSDEETGSFCSLPTLECLAREHDFGLVFEPALEGGGLAIARKGSAQFTVEAIGKSAHAGRDFEKGVSAVYALAHTLTALQTLSDPEKGITVNVGPLEGGVATNVVPDRARAWGNIRYPDDRCQRDLDHELSLIERKGTDPPIVNIRRVFNRPAKPLTLPVKAMAEAYRTIAKTLGQEVTFAATGGVCDGNILQSAGLPTLDSLGVRGGGLHTHAEWIDLASLVERSQLLASFMTHLTDHPPR